MPASGPQVLNLGHMGVWNVVVKNGAGSTPYINGTDYTLDAVNGIIMRIASGAIASGSSVQVAYTYSETVTAVAGGSSSPTAPTN